MDCFGISQTIESYEQPELAKFGISKINHEFITWRGLINKQTEVENLFKATKNHLKDLLTNLKEKKTEQKKKDLIFKDSYMAYLRMKAINDKISKSFFGINYTLQIPLPQELVDESKKYFEDNTKASFSEDQIYLTEQLRSAIALFITPNHPEPEYVRIKEAVIALAAGQWKECQKLILEETEKKGFKTEKKEIVNTIIKRIDREVIINFHEKALPPFLAIFDSSVGLRYGSNSSSSTKDSSSAIRTILISSVSSTSGVTPLTEILPEKSNSGSASYKKERKISILKESSKEVDEVISERFNRLLNQRIIRPENRVVFFFAKHIKTWLSLAYHAKSLYLPISYQSDPCYFLNGRELQFYLIDQVFKLSSGQLRDLLIRLLKRVHDDQTVEETVYSSFSKQLYQFPRAIYYEKDENKMIKKICKIIKNSNPELLEKDERLDIPCLTFEIIEDLKNCTLYFYFRKQKTQNRFINDHNIFCRNVKEIKSEFYLQKIKKIQIQLNMCALKAYEESGEVVWWQRITDKVV